MSNTHAPLILTIDIGSSSVRALLYDYQGQQIAGIGRQERYELATTSTGTVEADPDTLINQAARCIDGVLAQAGARSAQITAVAVDTFASSFLALDTNGEPITPLITYADTRNTSDAELLRRQLDEEAVHDRTGGLLRTSYWPARLAWLRRTEPVIWSVAASFVTLGEYLELQLFGRCRVSYSIAAWSGLLDRRRLVWDQALLAHLGITPDQLAPLVDLDEPLAGLRAAFAERWPALRSIPWFPAIGDGAAANIGSGCLDRRRFALTIGTSGALRVVQSEVATVPAGLWCYRVDRHLALLGGATSEGGNLYAWLRRTLQLDEPEQVEAALAAFPPDSHGLTVLPFLAGERSPGWAGNVPATLHGLTLATTPIAILRAGLEAVAYRFAVIHVRLAESLDHDHVLIASGSGLRSSPAWLQIFADVLGRPVIASAEAQATSRGVALLALRSLKHLPSLADASFHDGQRYEPDQARYAIYREAIERQQRLYEMIY